MNSTFLLDNKHKDSTISLDDKSTLTQRKKFEKGIKRIGFLHARRYATEDHQQIPYKCRQQPTTCH